MSTDFEPTSDNVWSARLLGAEWAQTLSLPADCDVSVPAPGVVVLSYPETGGFNYNIFGSAIKKRPADRPAPVVDAILTAREERGERFMQDGTEAMWCHEVEATWVTPLGHRWLGAIRAAREAEMRDEASRMEARRTADQAAFDGAYAHLRSGGEPTTDVLAGLHATGGVGQGYLHDIPAHENNISALRAAPSDYDRLANIDGKRAIALIANGVPWVMSARGADLRHASFTPPTAQQFHLPRRDARGVCLDFTGADLRDTQLRYLPIEKIDIEGARVDGLTLHGCVLSWRLLRQLRRLGVTTWDCDTRDVPPMRYRRWHSTSRHTLKHTAPQWGGAPLPEWHGPRACPRYAYIAKYARRTYARCMAVVDDQTAPAHVSRRALQAARAVAAADALLSGRYRGCRPRPSVERMEAAWAVITRATGWIDHNGPAQASFTPNDEAEDTHWSEEARWRRSRVPTTHREVCGVDFRT